jgi:hypothetical protein
MSKTYLLGVATVSLLGSLLAGQASAAIPATATPAEPLQIAQVPMAAGLTVTGSGTATAPADSAIIYLSYYSTYYPEPSEDPNKPPAPPPVASAADMKPVVDAVVAAGVPAANVEATADPNSGGGFRLKIKMDGRPTQAKVQAIVTAANTAALKSNKFATGGAQVGYLTNNCAALEGEARKLAIADGRSRANALASAAGVSLGTATAMVEIAGWGYGTTCPSSTDPSIYADAYSLPGVDLLGPAVVRVTSSVTFTYDMK